MNAEASASRPLPRADPLAAASQKTRAAEWLNDLAELQKQGRYFFSVNRYLFAASRRPATGL